MKFGVHASQCGFVLTLSCDVVDEPDGVSYKCIHVNPSLRTELLTPPTRYLTSIAVDTNDINRMVILS